MNSVLKSVLQTKFTKDDFCFVVEIDVPESGDIKLALIEKYSDRFSNRSIAIELTREECLTLSGLLVTAAGIAPSSS